MYMLPSTVIAVIICVFLGKSLSKYIAGTDLK